MQLKCCYYYYFITNQPFELFNSTLNIFSFKKLLVGQKQYMWRRLHGLWDLLLAQLMETRISKLINKEKPNMIMTNNLIVPIDMKTNLLLYTHIEAYFIKTQNLNLWGFDLCQETAVPSLTPAHHGWLQWAHWKGSFSIGTGCIFNVANEREQWDRLFHISARAIINGGKMKVAQPLVSFRSGMGSD